VDPRGLSAAVGHNLIAPVTPAHAIRCILVCLFMLYFFARAGHQTCASYVSMGLTTAVVQPPVFAEGFPA